MADFKTPSLAGSSAEFNSVLSTFDSIKSEVVAGLEADVADLVANLTISVVGDLASKLGDLVPEIPELPNVNLQSEMSSLLYIYKSTFFYKKSQKIILQQKRWFEEKSDGSKPKKSL